MTTEIKSYSPIEASITLLREEYAGAIYPVETTLGMKQARAARAKIRSFRTTLESCRKEEKAEALAYCKEVDVQAKAIKVQLKELEDPIALQITKQSRIAEEAKRAKAEAEQARVDGIHLLIKQFESSVMSIVGADSESINETLEAVQAAHVGEDIYAEFLGLAETAKADAISRINSALGVSLRNEVEAANLKAEREEQERQRVEFEAKQKIEDEKQRVIDEDNKRRKAEIDAQQAKIDAENAAIQAKKDAENAAIQAKKDEAERKARNDESDRLAEVDRQESIKERMALLASKKVAGPKKALALIYNISKGDMTTEAWSEIALICEANV